MADAIRLGTGQQLTQAEQDWARAQGLPGIAVAQPNLPQPGEPRSILSWLSSLRRAVFGDAPSVADQLMAYDTLQQQGHSPMTDPQMRGLGMDIAGQFNFLGPVKAYHGSPHTFSAFDASKIGTGEGAQAYGHGLYMAEEPSVASGYRARLAPSATGDPIPPDVKDALASLGNLGYETSGRALGAIRSEGPAWMRAYDVNPSRSEAEATAVKAIDDYVQRTQKGSLYEVSLAPEPEDFLHWDKPLSEQSPGVREKLKAVIAQHSQPTARQRAMGITPSLDISSGGNLYGDLKAQLGSPEAASAALRDAGIPGIRYLDAGSRSAGEGTSNYVVFDPSHISIVSRNGQPIALGKPPEPPPLDLSTEARMARAKAMGFDVERPVYHGTRKDIAAFDPNESRTGGATFFAEDPSFASSPAYAGSKGGGNVISAYTRATNPLVVDDLSSEPFFEGNAIHQAKQAGYDAIYVLKDGRRIIFDPSNIRSVHAKFDPAKSSSADLLASAAPVGISLGAASLYPWQEQQP